MEQSSDKSANKRLERAIKGTGKSVSEISEETGVQRRTIFRLFKEGTSIKSEYLQLFYDFYGIDPNYILFGDIKVTDSVHSSSHVGDKELPYADSEFTYIPFYSVRAEAGGGSIAEDKDPLPMAFRRRWVDQHLRTSYNNLFLMKVAGDSMYPTLNEDEIILVDQSIRTPPPEDIYVIRLDELLLIKRIQYVPPGKQVNLLSDNDHYAQITVSDHQELHIIGRVCWRAGML